MQSEYKSEPLFILLLRLCVKYPNINRLLLVTYAIYTRQGSNLQHYDPKSHTSGHLDNVGQRICSSRRDTHFSGPIEVLNSFSSSFPSVQSPKRKEISYAETGILIVDQVQPTILLRTALRFNLSEDKGVE